VSRFRLAAILKVHALIFHFGSALILPQAYLLESPISVHS